MQRAMKLVCAGCERIVEVTDARLEGGRIEISCPRCGEVSRLELATERRSACEGAAHAGDAASQPGLPACPKCAGPRGDEEACPRCGLVYARWTGSAATGAQDERLAAIFQEVEAAWTDEAVHGRFLEACISTGALGFAARCYGTRGDEIARRQLDRLTALAYQSMKGGADRRAGTPKVTRLVGWTLFVLILAGLVAFLFVMFDTMARP